MEKKVKIDLSHHLAHDIRNPASNIRSLIEFTDQDLGFLKNTYPDKYETLQENFSLLKETSNILHSRIESLVQLLRLQKTSQETINLKHEIDDAFDDAKSSFTDSKSKLSYQNNSNPKIKCDPKLIKKIFSEIFLNSFLYSEQEYIQIQITFLETKNTVEIKIVDNGIGFNNNTINEIHLPFKQTKKSKSPLQGTGVGLSFVNASVELLGGSMSISNNPTLGAEIVLKLPLE